jgi:cell division protein FtsA
MLAVGIDAGAAYTRCLVLGVENQCLRYLGHGEQASRGWSKGRLADPEGVAESIRWAVRAAEAAARFQIESALMGLGGSGIGGGPAQWTYELGRPRRLELADLEYAIRRASRVQLEEDRLLLQVYPQDFTVDGRAGFRNPRGMTAEMLTAHVHLVTASEQEHQCLVNALHAAHLGVEETVFEPVAAAYAALSPQERSQGAAVLDIGQQSSDLVVYQSESLLLTTSIPIGGDHFTRDIAAGLNHVAGIQVSYEDAELLKLQYGCALVGLTPETSLIEVPAPDERPSRETSRRILNTILESRGEDLLEQVRAHLSKALGKVPLDVMLLSGGGARMSGMVDLAERELRCQARIALPSGIADLPETLHEPTWTTASGLAMYSAKLKFRKETTRRAPGFLGLVFR